MKLNNIRQRVRGDFVNLDWIIMANIMKEIKYDDRVLITVVAGSN